MYHRIVKRRVRTAWAALDARRPEFVVGQLAPRFEHSFAGEHALGGVRRTREAQARWFARLFTLFPDISFHVRDVLVSGPPWRTRAVAIVDVTLGSLPGYQNTVVQLIELRWGRITRIENHEDTQALAAVLDGRAAQVPEARAAAIVS